MGDSKLANFSKFNMKIYIDVFSGDELFSDTYKVTLKDNVMYEVVGKYETRKEGEVVLEGANASEECADEGTDESSVSGIDVVLNHRLVETGFGDKKGFTAYLKAYMQKVLKFLEDEDRASEIDEFKTNINNVMKELMGKFKDVNGEERPVLMFFKHGLREEKC